MENDPELHFIFELPTRIKICLENGNRTQALSFYEGVNTALQKYKIWPEYIVSLIDECKTLLQ